MGERVAKDSYIIINGDDNFVFIEIPIPKKKSVKTKKPLYITSRKILVRIVIFLIIFCCWYYDIITTIWAYSWWSLWDIVTGSMNILFGAIAIAFSLWALSVDMQKVEKWIIDLVIITFLLLIVAIVYFTYEFSPALFLQLLSIILLHVWILVFVRTKHVYLETRIDMSIWWIAQVWVITFGLFVATIVTLFVWVTIVDAPLECETLYDNLQTASYSSIEPIKDASLSILDRSKQSVKDAAIVLWTSSEEWLIARLTNTVVDQVLEDKELVRDSFCEMVVTILEQRVDKSIRSSSVYILLFLLLSPFMTLLFRVVSIVTWFVLRLLKIVWVYSWKKRMRWIKELR